MSRITITASDYGFFTSSPVGAGLAPNVFLSTGVNPAGTVLSFDDETWVTTESLRYSEQMISVAAQMSSVEAPRLGEITDVLVSEISYYRMVDGEMCRIGTLELPEPTLVTATYLSFGVDDVPSWQIDLGDVLSDMLKQDGFRFEGGAGDDIFDPHLDLMPFRGGAVIKGYGGNDTLTGSAGDDRIAGGSGDDVLYDGAGTNHLRGGSGDDVITAGDRSVHSVLNGGSGNDRLVSGLGDDLLYGKSGHDTLLGGGGDDRLWGNKGRDVLNGGSGDDVLNGGAGRDVLTGGYGADVFVFNAVERGQDHITDFEDGIDRIQINGVAGFDALHLEQHGLDTWITMDGGAGTIILDGIDSSVLDVSDFLFG